MIATNIEQRLEELRAEKKRGQEQMTQLNRRRQNLQETLLRISGAIQVLEELLIDEQKGGSPEETESTNGSLAAVDD